MLKGIHPSLSPDLLATLARMGHGDEVLLADAHFPGHSMNERVIRSDGVDISTLLDAVLALLPLDTYEIPLTMMAPVEGDALDPAVEAGYMEVIRRHEPGAQAVVRLERFAFYDRTRGAYAVVMTGDVRPYANILVRKGVVTP